MSVRCLSSVGEKSEVTGEVNLYKAPNSITIPAMFGIGCFNSFYWSAALFDHYVIPSGFSMLGEYPSMGVAGLFGTGLIFGSTYQYSHHYAARAYESADGQRIGFQFHTILGKLGRKVEVSKENVRALNVASYKKDNRVMGAMLGSTVPLSVKGLTFNVLLDSSGEFDSEGKLMDLIMREDYE